MTAIRMIGLFAALTALGAPAAAAGTARQSAAVPAAPDPWQQAGEAYDKGDCATALTLLAPRLKAGGEVAEKTLAFGYDMAASCAYRAGQQDDAYRYAIAGTALDAASDWLWRFRLILDLERGRLAPAVATIEAMTQGRGRALNTTPIRWLYSLSAKLKDQHQDDLRRRLLRIMADPSFSPEEPFGTADSFRWSYAELLLADGDKAGATALVREIADPSILSELSFDPRFAPMLPAGFDLRAAVERSLASARDIMRAHPEMVEPINQVAMRLRQLGKPQEALAVQETARAAIARADGFTDAEDQANWWWDGLSRTYAMLGRYDEMVAAMAAGAGKKELGEINVSQVINLAEAQLRFGKAEEALKTLAVFDVPGRSMSPYGEMEMRFARGCANALAGRKDAVATDLAYLHAHDADHREALSDLLLCMGDLDGAAIALVRQLEDPERRAFTLAQLSEYDAPPVAVPPDPIRANLARVKARPELKAAIARAGGTRRIHLQPTEL